MSTNDGARPALHCITYGDPGGGKSTFATTWPKPMLVFLFDAYGKDGPYLRWARNNNATITDEVDGWGTPIKILQGESAGYMRLEYYNDLSPEQRTWELFEWRMKERTFFDEGWATVVIDSLTFMELMARMHARHVVNPNSKDPRQWFGYSTDALEYALLVQLQGFQLNTLVLAHINNDKDEVLGSFVRQLAAPGRLANRNELAGGYAELYRAWVRRAQGSELEYVLQTQRDPLFNAATQIEAADPSWQTYESLWTNFK
jgi:hypothetical protein